MQDINRLQILADSRRNPHVCFKYVGSGDVQVFNNIRYAFNYTGVNEILISTELTNTVNYSTLSSLSTGRGTVSYGPAGTGKTETLRDLGRRLGYNPTVVNVSEDLCPDYIKHLINSTLGEGDWLIFDEFNRINVEEEGRQTKFQEVLKILVDTQTEVRNGNSGRTNSIFFTINPGYAGKSNPQELFGASVSSFNFVAMTAPEVRTIIRDLLAVDGHKDYQLYSGYLANIFSFCSNFSSQSHYDFGLRAVKHCIAYLKQAFGTGGDYEFFQVVYDFLSTSLLDHDRDLLRQFIEVSQGATLNNCHAERGAELNTKYNLDNQGLGEKISTVLSLLNNRHGILLVGDQGLKDRAIETAQKEAEGNVEVREIDINNRTAEELYGENTPEGWKGGIIGESFRTQGENPVWFRIRGDLREAIIENLNTVLDNNRVLCLANGDRIPLNSSSRVILDTANADQISPAVVSRTGAIWFGEYTGETQRFLTYLRTRQEQNSTEGFNEVQQRVYNMICIVDCILRNQELTKCCKIFDRIADFFIMNLKNFETLGCSIGCLAKFMRFAYTGDCVGRKNRDEIWRIVDFIVSA